MRRKVIPDDTSVTDIQTIINNFNDNFEIPNGIEYEINIVSNTYCRWAGIVFLDTEIYNDIISHGAFLYDDKMVIPACVSDEDHVYLRLKYSI